MQRLLLSGCVPLPAQIAWQYNGRDYCEITDVTVLQLQADMSKSHYGMALQAGSE